MLHSDMEKLCCFVILCTASRKPKTWILCSVRFGIEDTPSLHNMSKKYIVMAHRKTPVIVV